MHIEYAFITEKYWKKKFHIIEDSALHCKLSNTLTLLKFKSVLCVCCLCTRKTAVGSSQLTRFWNIAIVFQTLCRLCTLREWQQKSLACCLMHGEFVIEILHHMFMVSKQEDSQQKKLGIVGCLHHFLLVLLTEGRRALNSTFSLPSCGNETPLP